ncbi:isopentenyl-diphosphate Delta-isomerase [candidate division KSB1 bacterium]|nr:isopentenyl-diphosphate Delta-isomerase [candidate division KSB1 bacterium]
MNDYVILVDEHDNPAGFSEKMNAHEQAVLHRAFSIVILNQRGEMLLQQRADHKYHSGGMWSNACCSHPRPGESVEQAAHRRLGEEMGFDCDLSEVHQFIYYAELDHGLTEHEYDHVLFGTYDGPIEINPDEVQDYKWIGIPDLAVDMKTNPDIYTVWFKILFQHLIDSKLLQ